MKKTPEANPNCVAHRPRPAFMPLGAANPIAVRSRKLMKNIKAMNGTRRTMTLWMVNCSRVVGFALLCVVSTLTPTSGLGGLRVTPRSELGGFGETLPVIGKPVNRLTKARPFHDFCGQPVALC